nr:amidohydrolase family protein [Motilimonas pumila]
MKCVLRLSQGGANMMLRDDIGSLTVGKKADVIILDRNIEDQLKNDVYKVHQIHVEKTYLDGKLIHSIK